MVEALRKCFLALLGGWLATLVTASLQAQLQSGTYLILSGTYVERGGFSGVSSYQLPYPSQAFIQLSVPPATGTAEMTILQSNLRPMFLRPFTNGVVSSNQIGFHYVTVHPDYPGVASSATVDYTLTATGSSILLEGAITSAPPCCDIPYAFEHHSVRATTAPAVRIRFSYQVELCWNSQSNQSYQVQYSPVLATNAWLNLGSTVQGRSPTNCVLDTAPVGTSQRFYRVVALP